MKPRIRPLSNLYFRWGKKLNMSTEQVAQILVARGVIKLIGLDRYQECDVYEFTKKQSIAKWNEYVIRILWESRHG